MNEQPEPQPTPRGGAPVLDMYSKNRSRYNQIVLLACVIAGLVSSSGCAKFRRFTPVSEAQPVTMFGLYELDMGGAAVDGKRVCTFSCYVRFVDEIPVTANTDSIPIFVIDSFCFQGECLDSDCCNRPRSGHDLSLKMQRERRLFFDAPKITDDLSDGGGYLVPTDYSVWENIDLPITCVDNDITVLIHARLIDRVTGEEIARESKRVPFLIKKYKRLDLLSRTSNHGQRSFGRST